MNSIEPSSAWAAFQAINRFRRAIRHFDVTPVAEADVQAVLDEARYAPSSGNFQPYHFHWVRDAERKQALRLACGQKAATSAAEIIVVVAAPAIALQSGAAQLEQVETSATLNAGAKEYHRQHIAKFRSILGVGGWPVWAPLLFVVSLLRPVLSLLPLGAAGGRQWAARNSMLAAQTLMLGAAAKGIDSCPMEGFSATQVARVLGLPRGSVIPVVIALGYRAADARIEERWRRPVADVVVIG